MLHAGRIVLRRLLSDHVVGAGVGEREAIAAEAVDHLQAVAIARLQVGVALLVGRWRFVEPEGVQAAERRSIHLARIGEGERLPAADGVLHRSGGEKLPATAREAGVAHLLIAVLQRVFGPQTGRAAEAFAPATAEVEVQPRDLLFIDEVVRLARVLHPCVGRGEREAPQIVVASDAAQLSTRLEAYAGGQGRFEVCLHQPHVRLLEHAVALALPRAQLSAVGSDVMEHHLLLLVVVGVGIDDVRGEARLLGGRPDVVQV